MAQGGTGLCATRLNHVEVVINPHAGGVGPRALAEMRHLLATLEVEATVEAIAPAHMARALEAAVARSPDLLIVLAGDGTARAACELCGVDGPMVAPLPGGTMNMLPHALYGRHDWKTALTEALRHGLPRDVSGGEIDGHKFYVAAMIGWPALWGKAREAAREHQLRLAVARARNAYRRAFASHVRFSLDGKAEEKAEALTILCPLVSKKMTEETALEVAALNASGLGQALRVGARALVGDWFGDWRNDPAVDMGLCRQGAVRGRYRLPALIDGETVRLGSQASIAFTPRAFRTLAPPPPSAGPTPPVATII